MQRANEPLYPSLKFAAVRGGEFGAALTLVYALLFVVYATVRSGAAIWSAGETDAGILPTMIATGASILWAALFFGAILSVLAALLGALSAVLIRVILAAFNQQHSTWRAVVLGLGFTLIFAGLLYLVLGWGAGLTLTPGSVDALTFWLGLPTLLYIAAGGFGAWRLSLMRKRNH